jgi:hypothetical protein
VCVEGRRLQGLTEGMNMLQLFRENRGEYTNLRGGLQGLTAGMNMLQLFRENRGEYPESVRGVSGAYIPAV